MELEELKDWALILGITVVFVVFNLYAIYAFLDGDKNSATYNSNYFLITVIVGAIAIAIGTFVIVDSVGLGLMIGGALLLLYGITKYWKFANSKVKAVLLGITLAALMGVAFYRFRKGQNNTTKKSGRVNNK